MVKRFAKNATIRLTIICLFLICGMSILGCSRTKPIKEQKSFWGDKDKCVEFLQGEKAQAERYLVEAIGE